MSLRTGLSAEQQLHQTFSNLRFEDFALSPVKGPIYQASAGGRILYYAPESEHVLFATIYDRNGLNLNAFAQDDRVRRQLAAIDPAQALAIGPSNAPTVIEFTDPDCRYCRALDKYWTSKAAEGTRAPSSCSTSECERSADALFGTMSEAAKANIDATNWFIGLFPGLANAAGWWRRSAPPSKGARRPLGGIREIRTLAIIDPFDQFGDQKIEIQITLSVAVGPHVDRHAVHEPGKIGAMV